MPNRCSAPGCRSNYSGETPTPVFKMPSGPPQLVTKWKSFLHRENIEDIKNIHVCLKHFHDEDVETYFVIPQPDGTNLEVKRTVPRLHRDAVPKFLPGCPSYLSVLTKTQTRFDRCAKERDQLDVAITLSLKQQQKDEERFKVSTLCELNSKVNNLTLPEDWLLCYLGMNQLHFIKPSISNENGAHVIDCSLTIDQSLCTRGFLNSNQITVSILKIQDLRDIENLLKELACQSINNHISFCQILESERRLKLSSILKNFSSQGVVHDLSLKEFIDSFSTSQEPASTPHMEHFLSYTRIFVN